MVSWWGRMSVNTSATKVEADEATIESPVTKSDGNLLDEIKSQFKIITCCDGRWLFWFHDHGPRCL